MVKPFWKPIWQFAKKGKYIHILRATFTTQRKWKAYDHLKKLYMNIHSSYICNSPNWKQPPYSSFCEWINKTKVCLYNRIQLWHRKDWSIDICTTTNEVQKKHTNWKKSNKRACAVWFHWHKTLESANQSVVTINILVVAQGG